MPAASMNSYTLSEITNIVGVDEKTLHLYAHKGLLSPNLLQKSSARFSEVDCARLKIIKRANDIGYAPENIFNLIGRPDEVLSSDDPLDACQKFAVQKYKQIFNELNNCEPLEQLNKKCDLKLLKSYIKHLEGGKEEQPYDYWKNNRTRQNKLLKAKLAREKAAATIKPSAKPSRPGPGKTMRPPEPSPGKTMRPHEEVPHPADQSPQSTEQSPQVQSYSVSKLWDYIQKVEGLEDESPQAPPQKGSQFNSAQRPNQETLVDEEPPPMRTKTALNPEIGANEETMVGGQPSMGAQTMPGEETVIGRQPSMDTQPAMGDERVFGREKVPPSEQYFPEQEDRAPTVMLHQGYEEAPHHVQQLLTTSRWSTTFKGIRRWFTHPILFVALILVLIVIGYVKYFSHSLQSRKTDVIATDTDRSGIDKDKPSTQADTKEESTVAKKDSLQPLKDKPAPPSQTPDKKDTFKDSAKKGTSDSVAAKTKKPTETAAKKTEPKVAADEKPAIDKAPDEKKVTAPTPDAPVEVQKLSLWHDRNNNIYRADFTITKKKTPGKLDPFSGYAFVHLGTADGTPEDPKGLLMPNGELKYGIPSQIRQGARFSIKNLIDVQMKTNSAMSPSDISHATAMIFSAEGILLLEQSFTVPIKPFISTAEAKPTPEKEKQKPIETATATTPTPTETPSQVTAPTEVPTPAEKPITTSAGDKPEPTETTPVAVATTAPQGDTSSQVETAGSEAVSKPPPLQESQSPIQETQPPAVKPQRTDHPDAVIWEQKSYDAAIGGNFDKAVKDATEAIELDPGRVNPYINRSWAYIEKNKLKEAIADCQIALAIDPKNTFAYNNRGLAYQRMSQLEKAKGDYRKACDLGLELGCQNFNNIANQGQISELINQSQTAFRSRDWDGVIATTTKVIDMDPRNAVAYTNRSAAYAQKNFLVKALKDSNDAIKNNPNFSLAYNNRGYVFELLGNNQKAAADYLKSCSLGLNLGCKNFDKLK